MNIPSSTYRVQLSSAFPFKALKKIIAYLEEMNISTVYASPIFQARKGSTHGYDVTDPLKINKETGTIEELQEISRDLKSRNMSWLQDIVPNHMAFDSTNTWLYDVLEKGSASEFREFFDIHWEDGAGGGKVMAPFLGEPLEEVVQKGGLTIRYDKGTFNFYYFDNKYPVSIKSYPQIISIAQNIIEKRLSSDNNIYKRLEEITEEIENVPTHEANWQHYKMELHQLFEQDEEVQDAILNVTETISSSRELLLDLLSHQYFQLAYWKKTEKEINYRRFFTINDLLCLRMEDATVFAKYHELIKELCDQKIFNGLRIDHIDGLFDPENYLDSLRKLVGPDRYIIIEKILEWEETLPYQWPIQGTSGYGFLAVVNHLFTDLNSEKAFTREYQKICPDEQPYEELIYDKKLFILKERMGGELNNLYLLMQELGLLQMDHDKETWTEALAAFMAGFPVYRIYPKKFPLSGRQSGIIAEAFKVAAQKIPALREQLEYFKRIFTGNSDKPEASALYFLQRCQQFTGPLAAKGVEDTAFYIYNRLISHNEVGDTPHIFGITASAFNERMRLRKEHFPLSVNATATHDTKRGEDARMRINVLSEMPEEWFAKVDTWRKINEALKNKPDAPGHNEEYFIYQTLIGALPQPEASHDSFILRTRDYMQKVLREAKVHTSWSEPDEAYEEAVFDFISSILESDDFKASFEPFSSKTAFFGAIYSLGQCLVKTTAPGIPDIYQGTELWDLSYVDPDNRRPVDYDLRAQMLREIKVNDGKAEYLQALLDNLHDGRIKMYTLYKCLQERRLNQSIFDEGDYLPFEVSGEQKDHVISYGRKLHTDWYIIIVPRQIVALCDEMNFPVGKTTWSDTSIALPKEQRFAFTNILTGDKLEATDKLYIHEALSQFPIAMLKGSGL
ncbi:malto-oligosyltrehalose synthase [Fulvivirga kasyanovii]|uniref:Malto-oligosyltrehalose synthase n=1 Tax=Fulvivirga kasyanovii TaxID=396812 RepID=A0ABW9RVH1_9BACT|nr:malto-oligosyltrehalose synthase [Fulvivirga kasyanovii]MTI28208.1 malto-oligosyltrehalose synthase [Fulvivirga kasyanovii]